MDNKENTTLQAETDETKASPQSAKSTSSAKASVLTPKTSSNDKVEQALEDFNQTVVKKPQSKTKTWLGTIALILIIALGIYFMAKLAATVGETELRSLDDILANMNVKYAIITLAVMLAIMLMEATKFVITTHATTGHFDLLNSIKVSFLGKYYDNITPFGSGGQPMQIYYLYQKGHSAGISTAIVMIKFFFQMMCWVIICFVLMLFNREVLITHVPDTAQQNFFMIAGWIGWTLNFLLPVSIIMFAIFPKITNKILIFFINIGTKISWSFAKIKERRTGKMQLQRKIKIIKRRNNLINSAYKTVKDFRSSFIVMSHKPIHFILLLVICVAEHILNWSFPYFIYISFATDVQPSFELMIAIMTLNVFATMSVSIVPTPGNSGVLENVVLLAFKTLTTSVVFWLVFSWRFFTYYIYILIGIGFTVFEFIRKLVRDKKARSLEKR